jgi:hypothetical protein
LLGRQSEFAELDVGAGDDLLEFGLSLEKRQLLEVAAVQVEQVECDQDDRGRLTLEFVLEHRKIRGAIGGRNDDFTVNDR